MSIDNIKSSSSSSSSSSWEAVIGPNDLPDSNSTVVALFAKHLEQTQAADLTKKALLVEMEKVGFVAKPILTPSLAINHKIAPLIGERNRIKDLYDKSTEKYTSAVGSHFDEVKKALAHIENLKTKYRAYLRQEGGIDCDVLSAEFATKLTKPLPDFQKDILNKVNSWQMKANLERHATSSSSYLKRLSIVNEATYDLYSSDSDGVRDKTAEQANLFLKNLSDIEERLFKAAVPSKDVSQKVLGDKQNLSVEDLLSVDLQELEKKLNELIKQTNETVELQNKELYAYRYVIEKPPIKPCS